jgi:site-specific DNA-methyltransferase (adenine-specific)
VETLELSGAPNLVDRPSTPPGPPVAAEGDAPWLAPWWKGLGRRYGHVFHSLCSYMGSFPPGLPRYLIEQLTEPGDVVLDPFSGRGTAPLEACLSGRHGVGVDLNPLASMLTAVKLDPPTLEETLARLAELERSYVPEAVGDRAPPEIRMLFEEGTTLPQILHMKAALDPRDRTDRFLLASLAGILHGNHTRDVVSSRCLSVSMPNTFSMSPGYLAKYIREKSLVRPPFDAFEKLRLRMHFEFAEGVPALRGRTIRGDARALSTLVEPGSAKLIVTSPPYLNVVRYGKFNWIRLWLLGESVSDVDRSLRVEATDRRLALSDRMRFKGYCGFLKTVLTECARVLRDDGVCAVTIGDVRNKEHGSRTLALEAWESMKHEVPLVLGAAVVDDVNQLGKVSKIWGLAHRGEATKVDRVLMFHKPGRSLPKPRWSDPAALIEAIAASPNAPIARPKTARPGVVRARPTAAPRKKTGT